MRKNFYLSPSIMCADLMNIEKDIKELENSGIDLIHIDLIDADFAPNLTFGPDFINQLRQITALPFEIHYMMHYPSKILKLIKEDEIENIHIVHVDCKESVYDLERLAREKGDKFGLALSPDISEKIILEYLPKIDEVLLLSVTPGFAGQPFIETSYERTKRTSELLKGTDILLCVDGGMSLERSFKMRECGADIFVGGTSSIFKPNSTLKVNVEEFKKAIENVEI